MTYQKLARNVCSALGLLAAATITTAAHAESGAAESKAPASEPARRAQVAFDLQDWPTAIKKFRAAYELEQRPEYLWGLAQALRMSGDCEAAIPTYKAYRRGDVTANQGTAAELMITKCEAEIAKRDIEAQRAQASSMKEEPPPAPVEKQPRERPLTSPAPEEPATLPEPKKFYQDALGDTLLVTGVVAASVGGYLLLSGNAQVKNGQSAQTYGSYVTTVESAEKKQLAGSLVLGAGGLFVAGALFRYLTFDRSPNEHVSVGLGGVSVHGNF